MYDGKFVSIKSKSIWEENGNFCAHFLCTNSETIVPNTHKKAFPN